MKVYWIDPDTGRPDPAHDDKVMDLVARCIEEIERYVIPESRCGVFIIDFADCTVVGGSRKVPYREVVNIDRRRENSILHGGFGTSPWRPRVDGHDRITITSEVNRGIAALEEVLAVEADVRPEQDDGTDAVGADQQAAPRGDGEAERGQCGDDEG